MPQDCQVRQLAPQPTVSIRGTASSSALSQTIGQFLGEVFGYVTQQGGEVAGMPFTRIHRVEGDRVDLEAGLPLAKALPGAGRITAGALPGGDVVSVDHFGPYEGLTAAREAVRSWAKDHAYAESGPPWEMYWTDPGAEPDTAKWRTEILLPVGRP